MSRSLLPFRRKRKDGSSNPSSLRSDTGSIAEANFDSKSLASQPSSLVSPTPRSTVTLSSALDDATTDSRFGIQTVSNPEDPDMDIWFVHGLTGDRESTWTHSNGTFTPKLVSAQFPSARVITYGYDANIVGLWQNTSGEGLRGYGKLLAFAISNTRSIDNKRPIYFIAHSLGGLVVEQALLVSLEPHEHRLRTIPKCTTGIIFMGTPHSGSTLATWGHTLAKLLNRFWRANKKPLSLLERNSEVLKGVEEVFQRHLTSSGALNHVNIFCFYETVPVDIVGFVVPQESATIIPYSNCGIDANHMDITKFTSSRDAGFLNLKGVLDDWIEQNSKSKSMHTSIVPAAPAEVTASTTVPFRRDNDFIIRESLDQISQICSQPAARAALVGLGGVGKSQIAIEYSYQVQETSPKTWVFWVHAGTQARFEEGYRRIAEVTKLDGWDNSKVDLLRLVRSWLCDKSNGNWLLILDNADGMEVLFSPLNREQRNTTASSTNQAWEILADFLPQTPNGSILITSRSQDVAFRLTGNHASIIGVQPMNQRDALTLFQKKLPFRANESDAIELSKALDYMPLAITQAAAYIGQRAPRMTVSRYLEEVTQSDRNQARLLTRDVGDSRRDGRASNSIIATWQISFDYLRREQPAAARLLSLMSLFDRQGIPELILKYWYENHDFLQDVETPGEEGDFEDDIHVLRSYSLVAIKKNGQEFEMHRLVQFSTKKWLELHNELETWKVTYTLLLSIHYPGGNPENWKVCQEFFPHAQAAVDYKPTDTTALQVWAALLYRAAWFAEEMGWYEISKKINVDCLDARKSALGDMHPDTLSSMTSLAMVLQRQGKYEEAEPITRQALAGNEKVLGMDDTSTLTSRSDLALLMFNQGRNQDAEDLNRQVLDGYIRTLGEAHSFTIISRTNLALTLQHQGKFDEAAYLNKLSLELGIPVLGKEHPVMLNSLGNLASVLHDQGKYDEAEHALKQVLEGRRVVLGNEHVYTLRSLNSLGSLFLDQGKDKEAERACGQAVDGFERTLGKRHPDTLTSYSDLARTLKSQWKFEEAEQILRMVLSELSSSLGESHPNTLLSQNHLASVLQSQKKYDGAEQMCRQALAKSQNTLGKEHPITLASLNNLAAIVHSQKKYAEARALCLQALEGRRKVLGETNPSTFKSMYYLASILHDECEYREAEEVFRQVLEGQAAVLGKRNPSTLATLDSLVGSLRDQGKSDEAESTIRAFHASS